MCVDSVVKLYKLTVNVQDPHIRLISLNTGVQITFPSGDLCGGAFYPGKQLFCGQPSLKKQLQTTDSELRGKPLDRTELIFHIAGFCR